MFINVPAIKKHKTYHVGSLDQLSSDPSKYSLDSKSSLGYDQKDNNPQGASSEKRSSPLNPTISKVSVKSLLSESSSVTSQDEINDGKSMQERSIKTLGQYSLPQSSIPTSMQGQMNASIYSSSVMQTSILPQPAMFSNSPSLLPGHHNPIRVSSFSHPVQSSMDYHNAVSNAHFTAQPAYQTSLPYPNSPVPANSYMSGPPQATPLMQQVYQSPVSVPQSPVQVPNTVDYSLGSPAQHQTSQVSAPLPLSPGRTALSRETSSAEDIAYGQLKFKILSTNLEHIAYDEKCHIMAQAAIKGDLEMIKIMIMKLGTHPGIRNNITIIEASKAGHLHVVDYLMNNPKVNPVDQKHYAMKMAVQYGHLHILERLLQCPKADAAYDQNYAIRTASIYGFADIVKRLLMDEKVDPTVKDFYPIRHAAKNGHMEVVELLISDHRVNKAALLISARKNKKAFGKLIKRLQSENIA